MRLLLANDDGIDAPGLGALEAVAAGFGQVWVVAPASEQSAKSHAFTMHEPLRVTPRGPRRFAVSGTPADAVYLALHALLPERPDLVLSGINRGSNLATDVHYSGTVAAAREAVAFDVPAVALSLHLLDDDAEPLWATARIGAARVLAEVARRGLPPGVLLNVNVPNVPEAELRGVRVAHLGRRRYRPLVQQGRDPRGRLYYWIGGPHDRFDDAPEADGPLCEAGWITVTPIELDITARAHLDTIRTWSWN